jgi:hypothetical protein
VALFVCYLRAAQTALLTSDPAGQALQAWAMWHGNPLLRGWWLGDISFYTVELPLSVVIQLLVGLQPAAIHIGAAVVYTAVVLLAALLARGRARGWEGVARALLAAGIMLAPSLGRGTWVFVTEPNHTGTMIPVLLALLVLDRAPERWWVPVPVAVLLTVAQVNDPQATVSAAVALAMACAVRACTEVARRQRPRRDRWYDLSLGAAALLSIAAAYLILHVIHSAGGFYVPPPRHGLGFAPVSAMPAGSWSSIYNVLILFGADFIGQPMGISAVFALLHLAGAAVGLWALGIGVRVFFTRADRVTQTMVVGTILILTAGAFGYYAIPGSGAHEILPVLPFCAVLAGRLLGGRLVALRLEPVLAAGLAVMLAALVYTDFQPKPAPANTDLAVWLQAHHLTSGLAGYQESNITTFDSQGRLMLIPVEDGGTAAMPYESDARWYDPAVYRPDFIVSRSTTTDPSPVDPFVVEAWYGTPAHVYHFEDYTIMQYNYNLLTRLTVRHGRPRPRGELPPQHQQLNVLRRRRARQQGHQAPSGGRTSGRASVPSQAGDTASRTTSTAEAPTGQQLMHRFGTLQAPQI